MNRKNLDNLIESISAQLPLTDESKKLLESVCKTPNLSIFGATQTSQTSNTENKRLPTQELDKASFLKLLRTCYLCSPQNKNYHECKKVNDAIIQKNTLPTLLKQLSDFQFIVGVETLIALQTRNCEAILSDPDYQITLFKTANSAPKHLRSLYSFALLQILGFRHLYKSYQDKVRKLPDDSKNYLTRKIFLPILFASFLDDDKSQTCTNILTQYDIFDIVLNKWIEPMSKILLLEVKKICLKEVFYFLSRFLRLYSESLMSQSPSMVSNRILPLMSRTVIHYPKLFDKYLADCDIFMNKNITENRFPAVLHFLSCSCNSDENAISVLKRLTNCHNRAEPLMKQFFDALKEAHTEIVSQNVSNCSKSALYLLKNLFKYLPDKYQEQIILMFNGSELDSPQVTFASFLWDFMKNDQLAPDAAKCLNHLSALHPEDVYRFFSDPYSFNEIGKMMETNAQISKSFVKIARNIISFSFCRKSTICSEIPPFAKFLVTDYFTSSIFKKFDRRSKRWSTLTCILETALDVVFCDLDFCSELPNNQNFVRGLISIVHQTASILGKPPAVIQESGTVRIDSDNLSYIIQFDCIAMTLMIRLITYNLMTSDINNPDGLSFMCKSFFSDKDGEASSLFTTFVSFLELTHPLASQLRYYSVKMLDLMCEIAGRLPSISVDSFYPHESQRVLKEMISTNLFKSSDINQAITQLDFISHTLSSQLPFAYSFVHLLGSSFVIASTSHLEKIAKEFPDWLLSLSHLISKLFQKLSLDSQVINQISSKSDFIPNIMKIIKMNLPEKGTTEDICNLIASKAELLNVAILQKAKIEKDLIGVLFSQMMKVLPNKFEPIFVDCKLNVQRFVSVELHRVYGKEFYVDTDLLNRYLVDDATVVEKAQKLNESLSIIDACTQLMCTIVSLLRTTEDDSLIPPVKDSLKLLKNVLKNDIYPDSTVKVFFDLVDVCLSNITSVVNNLNQPLLMALTYYMKKRPIISTFSIIAKLLASSEIQETEVLILMLEPCIDYSLKNANKVDCSPAAMNCACEIAFKLASWDNWIIKSQKSAECFYTLLPTSLGTYVVDFMTLVLMNSENAETLKSSGFFDPLSTIDFCDEDARSPIWQHLFNMITAVPIVSQVPHYFVSTHFNQIHFYLNENQTNFAKKADLSLSEGKNNNDGASDVKIANSNQVGSPSLLLFKTQLSIMELLARIAPNFRSFIELENPFIFEGILSDVSQKLRKSLLFLNESSQLKINKGGNNKYDRETYNEKTCNLLIIKYCLIFFNGILEFPDGDIPIDMNESNSSNPVLDLMDKAADTLKDILANDAGIFNDVCIESFEYALRIYIAKLFKTYAEEGGRKQIKETKNSMLRSINSVMASINKFQLDENDSFQLLDAANNYITSLM